MDPREYDWQIGDLVADPYMAPDERRMQPSPDLPKGDQWQRNFATGTMPAWEAPPTNLAAWPISADASPHEIAAARVQQRYRNALARDPESNQLGALAEMAAPQSPLDYALLASGPIAKVASPVARGVGYGLALAVDPSKAEAMLYGPNSRIWDRGKASKAMDMLLSGRASREIRAETGLFPTAGNILKGEISDKGANWIEDPSKLTKLQLPASAPAERVFNHPRAYEAYPELTQVPVTISNRLGPGVKGGFQPRVFEDDVPKVFLAPGSSRKMREVLGHELFSHGVQEYEPTWSIGGNPQEILTRMHEGTPQWDAYQRMLATYSTPMTREEFTSMAADAGATVSDTSYERYLSDFKNKFRITPEVDAKIRFLAAHDTYSKGVGEEEARAIAKRMNLGPRQIQNLPFEQSLDTPYANQIFNARRRLLQRPMAEPELPPGEFASLQLSQQQPVGFAPGSILGSGLKRASPEEINRAAAESRKGMTQPELRNLYDQLGLTGGEPNPLAKASLAAKQPQSVVDEAVALKLADRDVLNKLTPSQRLEFQKTGKMPGNLVLPSQEAAAPGIAEFAPVKKEVGKAEAAFDAEAARGFRPLSLFDLRPETLNRIPDVPQFQLPRIEPKLTDRLRSAQMGGLARIERAAEQAPEANWGWYNLMQHRDLLHKIHGPEQGENIFQTWVNGLAGTSMVNPIDNNTRSSTWYLQQLLQGKPLPQVVSIADPRTGKMVQTLAGGPPAGYGAKSQVQHADRVLDFLTNRFDPVSNAKPISYRENLSGNYGPRTVDTHDIRNMIGMPRALELFNAENSALLPGEYTYLEDIGGRAARRAGTPQAPQQAATWIGGGDYTGLKSYPAPLLSVLDRRAQVTAAVRGITPMEALVEAFTKGGRPLLGVGGVAAGALAARDRMGDLAAQGEYR